MVDPEDLVLVQRAQDAGIQLARRVQAMAERLLDHHAAPELMLAVLVLVLIGELRLAELLDHGAKEPVGDGEVEDGVALRAMGLFGLAQRAADLLVQLGLGQVALDVGHFLREPLPRRLVDLVDVELRGGVPDEAFQRVVKMVAPALRRSLRQVHADQREFLRQHLGAREVVERRHHQALGQVAAGAEDHHGAGIGRAGLSPRRRLNHLRGRRCPDRLVVRHGATPRRSVPPSDPATLSASVRGQWTRDPRYGRRSRSAWPRASFLRRCAPAASGSGRRAPW